VSRLESAFRAELCREFRKRGVDAQPVENELEGGFPDVNYAGFHRPLKAWVGGRPLPPSVFSLVEGAIETKVGDWPANEDTPFRVAHPERFLQQTAWLLRRWKAGGRAHVMLEMTDTKDHATAVLLLSAPDARELALHGATRHHLIMTLSREGGCWYTGGRAIPWDEILTALEGSRPS
jgi:hypothetical protein